MAWLLCGKKVEEGLKSCPIVYFLDFMVKEKPKNTSKYKTIDSF